MNNKGNRPTPINPQPQIKIALESLHKVSCKCGSSRFVEAFDVRVANRFQSPTGQPMLVKTPIGFMCVDCGEANEYDEETKKQFTLFGNTGEKADELDKSTE